LTWNLALRNDAPNMKNDFRKRLLAGEKLVGTMLTLPVPSVAEILAQSGFDWLFVDWEHGPFETGDIQAVLQAVNGVTACIVRVPSASELPIKKALDLGADGIIAPQVNSVEQARLVVDSSRYAPAGSRGVGLARAHGYGMNFQEYVEQANQRISVVVQAEHILAVENIESIVQVEGIDAVLIGPYDLSASMGKMGQLDDPSVVEAIERVTNVCQQAGKPLGIFGVSANAVLPYIERGYTLIVAGVDTLMLGNAAKKIRSLL